MKKISNVLEPKADCLENEKRFTKNVSEYISKVDRVLSSAQRCSSLFNPQAVSLRIRLREACERCILTKSINLQKMEEILWRKVFYEPLSTAKKLREGSCWTEEECGLVWAHLNDGIAFYHHYLMMSVDSVGLVNQPADLLSGPSSEQAEATNGVPQAPFESLFRSLTCLGDLARYMLDLPFQLSDTSSYLLSVRYYHQALYYNCEGGLTHSNLATVYSSQNLHLLAAVHYLRAITCEKPFVAAENNLKKMLEKSRFWLLENRKRVKESLKEANLENESVCFQHTCLTLLLYFLKNKTKEEVAVLCQDVLVRLGRLLDSYDNAETPDLSESTSDSGDPSKQGLNGFLEDEEPTGLRKYPLISGEKGPLDLPNWSPFNFMVSPESMVIQCALFILCVQRLEMQGSSHVNMSKVLIVSILLTVVTHINTRLEQRFSLIDPNFVRKLLPPQPEDVKESAVTETETPGNTKVEEKKPKKGKLSYLRRRKMKDTEQEDEESDIEENGFEGSDCSDDMDSLLSQSEDEEDLKISHLCSSEDEESDDDVKVESEEWAGLGEEEHLDLVEQEEMLAAVHVLLRWLSDSPQMVEMCGRDAENLWKALATLCNLISVDFSKLNLDDVTCERRTVLEKLKALTIDSEAKSPSPAEFNQLKVKQKSIVGLGSLPEVQMLQSLLPGYKHPPSSLSLNNTELNVKRLLELTSIMNSLSTKKTVPLAKKDGKYVVCEEKTKTILEEAKSETQNEGDVTNQNHVSSATASPIPAASPTPASIKNRPVEPGETKVMKVTSSMQSLTAQWLQHEVQNLERKTKMKSKPGGHYLVPDSSVLVHHLKVIKKMLLSPTHMIIIPQTVIDSLDVQKRDCGGARDAIRWLETKLSVGSRFMRVQRPHERGHIPLIKYPKKKEKETWEWIQVCECCFYLGEQMSKSHRQKSSAVTLLTTDTSVQLPKYSLSLKTLAEASGAVLLSVQKFVEKWESNSTGPG